jgi:hypothetical protein
MKAKKSPAVKLHSGRGKVKNVDGKPVGGADLDMRASAVAARRATLTPEVAEYSVSMNRARARYGDRCIDIRWVEARQAFYIYGSDIITLEMASANSMFLRVKEN